MGEILVGNGVNRIAIYKYGLSGPASVLEPHISFEADQARRMMDSVPFGQRFLIGSSGKRLRWRDAEGASTIAVSPDKFDRFQTEETTTPGNPLLLSVSVEKLGPVADGKQRSGSMVLLVDRRCSTVTIPR